MGACGDGVNGYSEKFQVPQHLLLVSFLEYNTALGNLTRSKLGLKCRQGIGLDEVERFWE